MTAVLRFDEAIWLSLTWAERILGMKASRATAAAYARVACRLPRLYEQLVIRVLRTLHDEPGALSRLPFHWLDGQVVGCRRLRATWTLDLSDNLQAILYFAGTYEPALLARLQALLRAGDVFVDIGAHVGVHSVFAARALASLGGGQVFSIEPTLDSSARLNGHAVSNGLSLTTVRRAFSDTDSMTALRSDPSYHPRDAGVRSLYGTGPVVETVACSTFDKWAWESGLTRLDVVKMDVEGAEPQVLRGMEDSLRRFRPRALVIECREELLARAGFGSDAILKTMTDFGYHLTSDSLHGNLIFELVSQNGPTSAF